MRAKRPVTKRQLEVMRIIERGVFDKGFPPTRREICLALGMSAASTQAVDEHLRRLVVKGMLLLHPRVSRGITITAAGHDVLVQHRGITL